MNREPTCVAEVYAHDAPVEPEKVTCSLKGPKVKLRFSIEVPLTRQRLWDRIADLRTFLCVDPYHSRVIPMRDELKPGVDLVLEHRVLALRFLRFGRLLTWHERVGYSFSDLSARGFGRGFPHIFTVRIEPSGEGALDSSRCRLVVEVKGKWTATWFPHWLRKAWLVFTCRIHARLLVKSFHAAEPS